MGMCHSRCLSGTDVMTSAGLGLPKEFTVIRELGYGQEGKTYLVHEKTSKGTMKFALKAIPRGNLLHPEFVLRGLRNQSCLCFVHVVKFLEVLLTPSHLIIKFEYVDGGNLFQYVCRQPSVGKHQLMDEEHARFLFIQIVYALHHCHEHRVAHRDIKFANILCTRSRNPIIKICDFGLSKGWVNPQDAISFSSVGSLMFMSPEVVSARHATGKRKPYDLCKSDVWGLGIILFTMLFGRFPFLNSGSVESRVSRAHLLTGSTSTFSFLLRRMEVAHRSDPLRLTNEINQSDLSPAVKKLLLSMLNIDEKHRIGLDQLIDNPWVKIGLSRQRARVIAKVRWPEEASARSPPYTPDEVMPPRRRDSKAKTGITYMHGELVPGSPAANTLEQIVHRAAHLGDPDDDLVRWLPPGVRLRRKMSADEKASLEAQGVRLCTKCQEDPEDKYHNEFGSIRIMPSHHH